MAKEAEELSTVVDTLTGVRRGLRDLTLQISLLNSKSRVPRFSPTGLSLRAQSLLGKRWKRSAKVLRVSEPVQLGSGAKFEFIEEDMKMAVKPPVEAGGPPVLYNNPTRNKWCH